MVRNIIHHKSWWFGAIFIAAVATINLFLFGPLGYTPTDDGFILSGARRILWGEVPHRDFITIRPLLPYLLYAPVVFLGGDYTYLLSRFTVLIELALIAWVGVLIAERVLRITFSPFKKILLATFAFIYGTYDFPLMAWYSIDAVLFATVGLLFCLEGSTRKKFFGYALIGLSPLARQNFLLVGPILLVLLGDFRKLRYWTAYFLPLLLMGFYLLVTGALPDAILQLTTHMEFFQTAVAPYYRRQAFIQGIACGILGVYFCLAKARVTFFKKYQRLQSFGGKLLLLTGLLYAAYSMLRPDTYYHTGAFFIFGMVIGVSLYIYFEARHLLPFARLGTIFTPIAWSVSVSLGHNTPALATGGLVTTLLSLVTAHYVARQKAPSHRPLLVVCILLFPITSIFVYIRRNQIYEERPAQELTFQLDGIYPGGNGLRTNIHTYTFLSDLKVAIEKVGEKQFIILPDVPGYWAAAPQKNPLPIDWPNKGELYTKPLMDRVLYVLKKEQGKLSIILQKVEATHLAESYSPVDYTSSPLLIYVTENYHKTGESEFFSIYE